jgi:hypothetical protein
VASSLSPLTSDDTIKTTSYENQSLETEERQGKNSNCTDVIVLEYSRQYNASQSVGGKVDYGYLGRLIDEKKKEFGMNSSISSKTIRDRTQRGALTTHCGAKSPLEEVEVALVQICIQMGKIRQPLSCTEAIVLMNDMIENTNTNQKLIDCH